MAGSQNGTPLPFLAKSVVLSRIHAMKRIDAKRLDGSSVSYIVPSPKEAREYSYKTKGEQFDLWERERVTGGLPMVWERVHAGD